MKLTILIITVCLIQVSAATKAQITLNAKDMPLQKVLKSISKQSGFDFIYADQDLSQSNNVSVKLSNATIETALKQCFEGQPLIYVIEDKTVMVKKKDKSFFDRIKKIVSIPVLIKGKVTDTTGTPLLGATITINDKTAVSSSNGLFELTANTGDVIKISYIGYRPYIFTVTTNPPQFLNVVLHTSSGQLSEVIVSTGYQTLPKERATGSFEVVDSKKLNFTVSSNIMDHIDGIVSGVNFDNRQASTSQSLPRNPTANFTIRGLSSINSEQTPLIVIDNFPYKGDINNINPNDVESITILKDAAAASIWGAQAGNGVVVITTKKGKYNQAPTIDFNTSVSIGTKPDLFSQRQISTTDYIALEKSLFNQGYYDGFFADPVNNSYPAFTPVVNLLEDAKNGLISQANADAQIQALSKHDVRNDLLKYFYKPAVNQQYNLNVRGGGEKNKYFISAGYNTDRNPNSSYQDRYTLNASNTYSPVKNLEITIPIYFVQNNSRSNYNYGNNNNYYPYAQLADAQGNPLDINYQHSASFSDMAVGQGLYSYHYSPLQEFRLNQDANYNNQEIRVNPSINYKFLKGFSIGLQYQYDYQHKKTTQDQSDSSYYVRNAINQVTEVNADGSLTYPINRGDFLNLNDFSETDQDVRTQLTYNHDIGKDNRIDAIVAYEHSESKSNSNYNGYYGYNPNTGQLQTLVDYVTPFHEYGEPSYYTTTLYPLNTGITDNFYVLDSKLANIAYTYKSRYILSASGRIDQTNLFGANSNHQQKILWSSGASWIVNQESFYHLDWLPNLKLRATYGFQGNIPANYGPGVGVGQVTALTPLATINYSMNNNSAGLPYASLNNLSNPNLTWEKIGQLNVGIDFGVKNNILSGSLEYYHKDGSGLIASYPIDPTTGIITNNGNVANIKGNGIDITINSKNINGKFQWSTRYIFNHNTDKVTKYLVPTSIGSILQLASSSYPYDVSPVQGNAIYGVYSLKSAGLDPTNGNPRGYYNGTISEDYSSIMNNTPLKDLVYSGSANPTYFGSMMNNFSYGGISLAVNMTYKAGFYFHAQGVNYSNLYGRYMLGPVNNGAGYAQRWQKPGDEKFTTVPSAPTAANNDYFRSAFYQASSDLVEKGDNVRLQDAQLTYDFKTPLVKRLHLSYLQVYANATLNTIIWRANKLSIDPEYPAFAPSKVYSLGLRASF